MYELDGFRVMLVPEDAADGCELIAKRAKKAPPWVCECGARNEGWRDPCGCCGCPNEDADE